MMELLGNDMFYHLFNNYIDPLDGIKCARLSKSSWELLGIRIRTGRLSKLNLVVRFFIRMVKRYRNNDNIKDMYWNPAIPGRLLRLMFADHTPERMVINPNISESFAHRLILNGEVSIDQFYDNHGLSELFFEKYLGELDFTKLFHHPKISVKWLAKHFSHEDLNCLIYNPNLVESDIKEYEIDLNAFGINCLMRNRNFGDEFWLKHLHKINLKSITSLPVGVSGDFLKEHFIKNPKSRLSSFSSNEILPDSFFEENLERVQWVLITTNKSRSEAFLVRHLDKLDPQLLGQANLPFNVMEDNARDRGVDYIWCNDFGCNCKTDFPFLMEQ